MLHERLKIARVSTGKSQKEMAEALGIGLKSWQVYEQGSSVPGGSVFESLVRLGFNANWLLTGEGEMRRGIAFKHLTEEDLAFGKALCEIGTVDKQYAYEATPGWQPNAIHPASKSTPPNGPDGYSDYERRFVLLRDVIETYESMRPGRDPDRKAREITIIYRHFMEHFEPHLDEVEISEYINTWM